MAHWRNLRNLIVDLFSAAATARICIESLNLEKLTIVFSVFLPIENFKQGGGMMYRKRADYVFS
jgi:hypothetical protein